MSNDDANSSQDETLMHEVSATLSSGAQYVNSCLDLVMAETKLAIASIVWIVALATLALLLAMATWVLLCLSLSYSLIDTFGFSTAQTLILQALLNLCLLLITARLLGGLLQGLSFSNSRTLSAAGDSVGASSVTDSPENPAGYSPDNSDENVADDRKKA